MDTETTGLSGGAGTVAFLVGLGRVEGDRFVVYQYMMSNYGAEALLLGCTHYDIIKDAISRFLGPDITLVSAAESGAAALCSRLLKEGRTGGSGETRFFTSGDSRSFSEAAALFLGRTAEEVPAESVPPEPLLVPISLDHRSDAPC